MADCFAQVESASAENGQHARHAQQQRKFKKHLVVPRMLRALAVTFVKLGPPPSPLPSEFDFPGKVIKPQKFHRESNGTIAYRRAGRATAKGA